jgi:signal transduction histidine kinase
MDNIDEGMMEVTLKWPENSFDFEYAALSFTQPEKNQYAYYLEGFEKSWNTVGSRRYGQYTNIPGGSYTLRVKGSNNDDVWNEVGIAMKITIVPPIWQTWWFIGIVILVLAGSVYGGYRLRIRNLEARGSELKSQVEDRTAELMQTQANLKQSEMEKAITEERNRLARDLHDSVTQSIYSLTLLAEAGRRMIRGGDLKQAEGNQTRLGEIAQQALQEMRLLVYELRPHVLQSEGLIGALEHRLEAVERRAGINARMQVELEIDLHPSLEEELFHISMEALNNALKHAKASEVALYLKSEEDNIILTVEDNGRGFDQELVQNQAGMGLTSMTERVEKIRGGLSIESRSGAGTRISVSVPLHSKNHASSTNLEFPL